MAVDPEQIKLFTAFGLEAVIFCRGSLRDRKNFQQTTRSLVIQGLHTLTARST